MTRDDPHHAVFGNGKQLRLGDGTESTDDQPDVRLMWMSATTELVTAADASGSTLAKTA